MNFTALTEYLDSLASVGVPGCDLIVCLDHEPVYRHAAGFRDDAREQPMRGDEMYWLYSCTKVFTSCAAMQLVGEGRLDLDDPVAKWLPAYGSLTVRDGGGVRPAQRVMTVRHLLSMQSGLDYDLEKPEVLRIVRDTDAQASTREIVDALARSPLCFEPGTDFLYSLSHDVLAAVIEAVSGERFSDYLRAHIFAPLGLTSMAFSLTDDLARRLCAAYRIDETGKAVLCPPNSNNYRLSANYESGGAGLAGDVKDYSTFADALACGGESRDGRRILAPEMIQLWRANQLGPQARRSFDGWKRLGYSYALGVRTRVDLSAGGPGSLGEFGWDGAAGAWTMIDPSRRLSAFYAMHVRNFGYSYDVIHPILRGLIYEGLGLA